MLIALQQLLARDTFTAFRDQVAADHEFALFYDALARFVVPSKYSSSLLTELQTVLALYQGVARRQYSDYFFAPQAVINQLALGVATLIADETLQSLHSIVHAQSLNWRIEEGRWFDYIGGSDQLPADRSKFAIADSGEICQLEDLLDSVCRKFSSGQRNLAELWQSNDPRCMNQPLPQSFLQALRQRFPLFKVFYDHIARIVRTGTPYRELHDLRTGLYNGSVGGANFATKGEDYDAGTAANEAINVFSPWWEDIRQVSYLPGKSLRQALGELLADSGRTLEELLAIIVREQSANISSASDSITCVQLRGDELAAAITRNKVFLDSFETHDLTAEKLAQYREQIHREFAQFERVDSACTTSRAIVYPAVFRRNNGSRLYENYAFSQLWHGFSQGSVGTASILELSGLVQELTEIKRQELLFAPFYFSFHEKTSLSPLCHCLRLLESKLKQNCLLPVADQQPLSVVDRALVALVASNLELLAMVSSRYEYILFSFKQLVDLAFQHGLSIDSGPQHFTLQDDFNLAYYIEQKTRGEKINGQQRRLALHRLRQLPPPTQQTLISPLHQAIKNNDAPHCSRLIQANPAYATHVEWGSGNSSLTISACYGQIELCLTLLRLGVNPSHRNKLGQTAETLWATKRSVLGVANPLVVFHQELIELAKNSGQLTARQEDLWLLVKQHRHLLTWHLTASEDSFLRLVFTHKNNAVMEALADLPDWHALVALTDEKTLSILHLTAARGEMKFFPHLVAIAVDDQNNRMKRSALHLAAMYNRTDFCRLLLEHHANIDLQDSEGHSALMLAVIKKHAPTVMALIELGADITLKNSQGKTAIELWPKDSGESLFHALYQELTAFVKTTEPLTLRQEYLLRLLVKQPSLLMWNLAAGSIRDLLTEVLLQPLNVGSKTLLRALAAQPDKQYQPSGRTLLQSAAYHDCEDIVQLLFESGAALDLQGTQGNSALMLAVMRGNEAVVQRLLRLGSNPTLKNSQGKTPAELWPATTKNLITCFHQELLSLASNTGELTEQHVRLFEQMCHQPYLTTWKLQTTDTTFLRSAFIHNNLALIEKLSAVLPWHHVISQSEQQALSLLHLIAARGHVTVFPYLTTLDIDGHANTLQRTALHLAAFYGREAFCQLLLSHQAKIDLQDSEGHTALMLAVIKGHKSVCHLLLQAGANCLLKNKRGESVEMLWKKAYPAELNPFTIKLRESYLQAKKISFLALLKPPAPPRQSSIFSWFSAVKTTEIPVSYHPRIEELRTAIIAADFMQCPLTWTADDLLHQVLKTWQEQFLLTFNATIMAKINGLIQPSADQESFSTNKIRQDSCEFKSINDRA